MEYLSLQRALQSTYNVPSFLLCSGNESVKKTAFCMKFCQDPLFYAPSTSPTFHYTVNIFTSGTTFSCGFFFFFFFNFMQTLSKISISSFLLYLYIIRQHNVLRNCEERLTVETKGLTTMCLRSLKMFGLKNVWHSWTQISKIIRCSWFHTFPLASQPTTLTLDMTACETLSWRRTSPGGNHSGHWDL